KFVVKDGSVRNFQECLSPFIVSMAREAKNLATVVAKVHCWDLVEVEVVSECQRDIVGTNDHLLLLIPVSCLARPTQPLDQNQRSCSRDNLRRRCRYFLTFSVSFGGKLVHHE